MCGGIRLGQCGNGPSQGGRLIHAATGREGQQAMPRLCIDPTSRSNRGASMSCSLPSSESSLSRCSARCWSARRVCSRQRGATELVRLSSAHQRPAARYHSRSSARCQPRGACRHRNVVDCPALGSRVLPAARSAHARALLCQTCSSPHARLPASATGERTERYFSCRPGCSTWLTTSVRMGTCVPAREACGQRTQRTLQGHRPSPARYALGARLRSNARAASPISLGQTRMLVCRRRSTTMSRQALLPLCPCCTAHVS